MVCTGDARGPKTDDPLRDAPSVVGRLVERAGLLTSYGTRVTADVTVLRATKCPYRWCGRVGLASCSLQKRLRLEGGSRRSQIATAGSRTLDPPASCCTRNAMASATDFL